MIHIACNIDDNYIMQCCTTLVSVMYNNRNEQITFHIIAEFLSNEAKSMLTEEVEKYNQQIHFYAYNLNMNLSSFKSAHISLAAYLRLFVADILPVEIHKILYLDCDLIINDSIKDLWETDVTSYAVAAVEDMWSGKTDNYERLSYDASFSYFNAGVLLVNLNHWREMKFQKKAMQYIPGHIDKLVFNDQDVLNALLYDKKQFLPFRYNVQDGFLRRKRRIRPTSIPLLDEELKHPVIIHYTGGKKPWQYKSQHPYKNLYFRYLDLTEWKGERPQVPFSYRIKQAIDKVLYALRLAKPKYRNIT